MRFVTMDNVAEVINPPSHLYFAREPGCNRDRRTERER